MVAEEEVGRLARLAVLLGEAGPQARALGDVVARLVGVAQPHPVGLVLEVAAVAAGERGGGEEGGELGHHPRLLVVDGGLLHPREADGRELDPHLLLELPTRVLVGGVHQLVAEHDGQLVVVHVLHEAGEDVDGVVAHGEGVPLLVVDGVDADAIGVEIGRGEVVHDPAGALDLGAVVVEASHARGLGPSPSRKRPACTERCSAASVALFTSPSNMAAAVGLGLQLAGHQDALVVAQALGLELVAQGDGGDGLGLALPLELGGGGDADPLAVGDQDVALSPFEVAVDLLFLDLGRA